MTELSFTVAPGAVTALTNTHDDRAYFTFTGDLGQMGCIEAALRQAGYPVVKSGVYPGFAKEQEDLFRQALAYVFEYKIDGWWNQEVGMVRYGICTQEEFRAALSRQVKDSSGS